MRMMKRWTTRPALAVLLVTSACASPKRASSTTSPSRPAWSPPTPSTRDPGASAGGRHRRRQHRHAGERHLVDRRQVRRRGVLQRDEQPRDHPGRRDPRPHPDDARGLGPPDRDDRLADRPPEGTTGRAGLRPLRRRRFEPPGGDRLCRRRRAARAGPVPAAGERLDPPRRDLRRHHGAPLRQRRAGRLRSPIPGPSRRPMASSASAAMRSGASGSPGSSTTSGSTTGRSRPQRSRPT